jgi:hypothetical protein
MTRTTDRRGWAAGIATALAMTAGAASASTIYTFHQTGSTPGDLPIAIEMVFDGTPGPIAGTTLTGDFAGLTAFVFRTTGIEVDLLDLQNLQGFCAANPFSFQCAPSLMTYDLGPDEGSLRFNNTSFDFSFSYGDGWLTGSFNTDFPGPAACRQSGACTYEGRWLVAVAEPATLGLLAAGLVGLAHRGKRRTGRPALAS